MANDFEPDLSKSIPLDILLREGLETEEQAAAESVERLRQFARAQNPSPRRERASVEPLEKRACPADGSKRDCVDEWNIEYNADGSMRRAVLKGHEIPEDLAAIARAARGE